MTAVPVVFGITADGQEIGLSPDDLGMNDWQFLHWIRAIAPDYKKFSDSQAGNPPLPSLRSWLKSTRLFAWLRNRGPEPISAASANEVASQSTKAVSPALINGGLATYQQEYGKRFVRLRVEDNGVVVTRSGAQKVPPLFVAEIAVPVERP